jgi:hypothetical protein
MRASLRATGEGDSRMILSAPSTGRIERQEGLVLTTPLPGSLDIFGMVVESFLVVRDATEREVQQQGGLRVLVNALWCDNSALALLRMSSRAYLRSLGSRQRSRTFSLPKSVSMGETTILPIARPTPQGGGAFEVPLEEHPLCPAVPTPPNSIGPNIVLTRRRQRRHREFASYGGAKPTSSVPLK